MALTTLDAVPALVIIDLQKGIVGLPTVSSADLIVERSAQLARAFRERGLPVILVNVDGRAPGRTEAGPPNLAFPLDWSELVPELNPQPTDLRVTKQRWGAFLGTNLNDLLRQLGVTQIFLAGIATSAGVESTGRSAYDYGYNVVFVTDAMTDRNAEIHRLVVAQIFPRMGETDTAENVLRMLKTGNFRNEGA
jgi:nicotinamidase-related amidase